MASASMADCVKSVESKCIRAFRSNDWEACREARREGPARGRLYSPVVNGAIGHCRLRHSIKLRVLSRGGSASTGAFRKLGRDYAEGRADSDSGSVLGWGSPFRLEYSQAPWQGPSRHSPGVPVH